MVGGSTETAAISDGRRRALHFHGQHGEALFNEVYDQERGPNLLKGPGAHPARPSKSEPTFTFNIAGAEKKITHQGATYCAIYEIDGPQVPLSPQWARAGEAGGWPGRVRPFTRNRRHALYQLLSRRCRSADAGAALAGIGGLAGAGMGRRPPPAAGAMCSAIPAELNGARSDWSILVAVL